DLPGGVMVQWRRWCLDPEYLLGVEDESVREKYETIELPITSFSFTDDELMSEKNINSIHGFYSKSRKTMKRLSPEDIGVSHIGHFGFFKDKFEKTLWQNYLLTELKET
ncbi:MAG: alpha/beta hydrolase, partial [Gammaproteobacteria bacterium]|nr:alpha/beta hydrolase [Gammaproteobacteria bacterium]